MTVGSCFRAVRVAIPDIEEPASCGVNNGKGEVVPGGPTKCQSRTKLYQWKLEGSRCPGLSRWLDDNSPAPAFDQIAPRTNPKLVLLDKEPETLGNQLVIVYLTQQTHSFALASQQYTGSPSCRTLG